MTEVLLVEDNHVVEQFASDGANDSLGEGVLPRRARCGENPGGAHTLHPLPKLAPEDAVAIAEQVGRRRVIGECFDNLLRGPSGGGAIEVRDLAATVQQDDKYVEQTEGRRRYDEKVDRDELGEVVLEERSPRLRGWPWATGHKPGNGALRNVESELEKLPVDTRCTPERIRERHVADEIRKLRAYGRSTLSLTPTSGRPGPEGAEALPVPANHRLRANNVERLAPPLATASRATFRRHDRGAQPAVASSSGGAKRAAAGAPGSRARGRRGS